MRIPDLLVDLKKLEERVRLLSFDINQMWRVLGQLLPESEEYRSIVSRETESKEDSPKRTRGASIVEAE